MTDHDRLRQRLVAAGADVAPEMVPLLSAMLGPLLESLDAIAAEDLGDTEPFSPVRLVRDAAR